MLNPIDKEFLFLRINNLIKHSFLTCNDHQIQYILNNDFKIPNNSGVKNFTITALVDPFSQEHEYQEYMILQNAKEKHLDDPKIFKEIRIQSCIVTHLFHNNSKPDGLNFRNFPLEKENHDIYQSIVKRIFKQYSSWFYKISEETEPLKLTDYYRHCNVLEGNTFFRASYKGDIEIFKDMAFKKTFSDSVNYISGLELKPDDVTEDSMSSIIDNIKLIRY
jgi:hypothetical protein